MFKIVFLNVVNICRGHDDSYSMFTYLQTCSALNNERPIDSRAGVIPNELSPSYNDVANDLNNHVNGLFKGPHMSVNSPTFSRIHSQASYRQSINSTSKLNG